MTQTKLFLSNTTQALRLPKDVAFPMGVDEVEILVLGEARLVVPAGRRWDWFFDDGPRVSDDYLSDREQPEPQDRAFR